MLFTLQLYIGLQNIEANNFLEIRGNAFSYEGNFFGKSMDSDNFQYLSHYKLLIIWKSKSSKRNDLQILSSLV